MEQGCDIRREEGIEHLKCVGWIDRRTYQLVV
jgi:uncharacterized membrane-anchored protein